MVEISQEFENGNVNVKLDGGKLIKIPADVVARIRGIRGPRPLIEAYKGDLSHFFVSGPENEQVNKWERQGITVRHQPYITPTDFVEIAKVLGCKGATVEAEAWAQGLADRLHLSSDAYITWRKTKITHPPYLGEMSLGADGPRGLII